MSLLQGLLYARKGTNVYWIFGKCFNDEWVEKGEKGKKTDRYQDEKENEGKVSRSGNLERVLRQKKYIQKSKQEEKQMRVVAIQQALISANLELSLALILLPFKEP